MLAAREGLEALRRVDDGARVEEGGEVVAGGRGPGENDVVLERPIDFEQTELGTRPGPPVAGEGDAGHLTVGVVPTGLREATVVEKVAIAVVEDGRVAGEAPLPRTIEVEHGSFVPHASQLEAHTVGGRDQVVVEEELAGAPELEGLLSQRLSTEDERAKEAGGQCI